MLTVKELVSIATARLKDAEALYAAKRYDGAAYIAGYAVEVALKARICRTLKWAGFPSTASEFANLQSLKTHRLSILLSLSGRETKIKSHPLRAFAWSVVVQWDPESRYGRIGTVTEPEARQFLTRAREVMEGLI
jgi:HEPN domain-containing protein